MEPLRGQIKILREHCRALSRLASVALAFTCLFYFHSFLGLPNHVCASLGHHWAYHLLLHQQHGPGGNSGPVSTRCLRLLAGSKNPSSLPSSFLSLLLFLSENWFSPHINSYLPFSRQPSWPIMPNISVSVTPFL